MTTQDRDYEDLLRGALRAAAESIEPVGDGLQKIRHRLDSPLSARSTVSGAGGWLRMYWIRLGVRLEPATEAGRARLGRRAPAPGHGGTARQHTRRRQPHGRLQAAGPWMRPMLAVSAVVAVVVVGFVTLRTVQQPAFNPANSVTAPGGHHSGGHVGRGTYSHGHGPLYAPSQQPTSYTSGSGAPGTAPLVACSPTPRPKATTARPSSTPSRTPAATPSPSGSSSVLPTPAPTGSTPPAAPTPSGSPGASSGSRSGSSPAGGATATTTAMLLSPAKAGACGSGASPRPTMSRTPTPGA